MRTGCRGRVHRFATRRAGKLKLRAAVGANDGFVADPLAAGGTKRLAALGTGIVAQRDGAAAGRTLVGCLWRFVTSGAAATGAIILIRQQGGMALTTDGHLAGGAERLRRVEAGATGGAGDDVNGPFATEKGVQNPHGGTVDNRVVAAATVTRHLLWRQLTTAKGTISGEQGVAMGTHWRPGHQIGLTQRTDEIEVAAAMGANLIVFIGQQATMGAKTGLARLTIPIFPVDGHPTGGANGVKRLRLQRQLVVQAVSHNRIDRQFGNGAGLFAGKYVAATQADRFVGLNGGVALRAEEVKFRATGRARGRVRGQRRHTFRAKLLSTSRAGFDIIR